MSIERFSGFGSGVSLLCVTILCVLLLVALDLYKKRHILKFSSTLNGYRFIPIVGTMYQLGGLDVFSNLKKYQEKFTRRGGIWIMHNFLYFTIDPDEIKAILNNQNAFEKASVYTSFEVIFADSILLAKFNRWKTTRKLFAKCFSQPILQSFVGTIYERSNVFLKKIEEIQFTGVIEAFEGLSLNIFGATVLGLEFDEVNSEELLEIVRSTEDFLQIRIVTSYFIPDFIAHLSPGGRKLLRSVKRSREIIKNAFQKLKASRNTEVKNDRRPTIADIILEAEEGLFDEGELLREIFLFMGAGSETTGGTLAFTFTLLGMNPHIQEKVYLEVEKFVGRDGPINYNDLSNLKYTERAIRETMRLLPVIPLLARHVTADLDLGTTTIPAGTDIIISNITLHRDETYWPNPLEFNPDRFLPEEVAKRHPYSYIPFSGGPRNCIGLKYAMLVVKMVVANVIRNFHVTSNYKSVEDLKFSSAVALKPTHKLDCVFTARRHQ